MKHFTQHVAGAKYVVTREQVLPAEAMEHIDTLGNEIMSLENRVYSLEKEVQILSNVVMLGVFIGVYFGYRWYVENILSIPGVST